MAGCTERTQQEFHLPLEALFDNLLEALRRSKFELKFHNRRTGLITAARSRVAFGAGEDITIELSRLDPELTLLDIESRAVTYTIKASEHNLDNINAVLQNLHIALLEAGLE